MKSWDSLLLKTFVLVMLNHSAFAAVTAQSVGPANMGGTYLVSQHGAHVAYVGMKGTHLSVSVDGQEGPVLDELYTTSGTSYYCPAQASVMTVLPNGSDAPVVFNDSGEHYAYVGRRGQEYVVIYDGKEIARAPRPSLALNYCPLKISPLGRRVYWGETKYETTHSFWRLVMNGQPGPWSWNQAMTPAFSNDESRYAYNAARPQDLNGGQMLVIDGKEAGYDGMQPVFTADNKAVLSIAPTTADNPKPRLLVNGKPVLTSIGMIKIVPSPAGDHYAALVQSKIEKAVGISTLFIDGKEVPGTDGVQQVWFSADGKHYAAACMNTAAQSMFMVVDGKKQQEYQSISADKVYWTPDGAKFIYTVTSAGRAFVVVNGQEFPVDSLIGYEPIIMPASGNHVMFAARDGSNRSFSLNLDGQQVLPAGISPVDNTISFSPDGAHYMYFFTAVGRAEVSGFVLDGTQQTKVTPTYFGKWVPNDLIQSSIVFSPDSKHYAYMAGTANPQDRGLYVDGQLISPSTRAGYFPSFTSDSRHLFWLAEEKPKAVGQPPSMVVYLDGNPQVNANGYFFRAVRSWSLDKDGTVTFLAAEGDTVKRYQITASADSDVDKMISEAQTKVDKARADAKAAVDKAADDAAQAKAAARAQADAAAAKRKADDNAAMAARKQAYADAYNTKKLKYLNAQRQRQGQPPLDKLPE